METSQPRCYDQAAMQALSLAREESRRLGDAGTGSEHLLLGLLREDTSIAGMILRNWVPDLEKARIAVQLTKARLTEIIQRDAPAEAMRLGSDHIGAEHLLLALLRDDTGTAATVLKLLGIDSQEIRGGILRELGGAPAP